MLNYYRYNNDIELGVVCNEIDVAKEGLVGKLKLGFKYIGNKL
jgi:hypothetical protein